MMRAAVSRSRALWLAVSGLGCSAASPASPPPSAPAAPSSPGESALPVAKESAAVSAVSNAGVTVTAVAADQAPAPSRPPEATQSCITPPDPEFDRESPWSKALGERLMRELPKLAHCTTELLPNETTNVTLRFIYASDGSPRSGHIVEGASAGCAAAECIQRALGSVRAPKLAIPQGAFDLPLSLERGAVPRRTQDERAGLADAADSEDPASCVDPVAARLSRSNVDEIVSSSFEQLQSCYAHAITRDHTANGTVTFEFVIGLEGEVVLAQARDSTLYDCEAIECMLVPFRQLRFPPPLGRSVRVLYPIRYSIEQPSVQLR